MCAPTSCSRSALPRARSARDAQPPRLGHHFLYANLAHAQSKQDVLDPDRAAVHLPAHFGKNFDALSDCLTDPLHKSGPQPGFIVVLEQIPATAKVRQGSPRAASGRVPRRSRLLGRKRYRSVFLFFSVARSATTGQSRTGQRGPGEPMPPCTGNRHRRRLVRRENAHRQAGGHLPWHCA